MPIAGRVFACLLIALAMLLGTTPARAAASPALLKKMGYAPEMHGLAERYALVSSGVVLYDRCPTEYAVDDAKKAFIAAQFDRVSKDYMAAYDKAHHDIVRKLPDDAMIALYRQSMLDQQKRAKMNMVESIETLTCSHRSMQQIDAYFEQLRHAPEPQKN